MLHEQSYYDKTYCAIVCPYCKDVHECPSVHDFCRHYAEYHSDREGLLSPTLLLFRTWEWRDEREKEAKKIQPRMAYEIVRNRMLAAYDGDWLN
jgi:hypothetical protein